jgi:hypothetical protein
MAAALIGKSLTERFWLCDACAREMTVIWGGTEAKVVNLPKKVEKVAVMALPPAPNNHLRSVRKLRRMAAATGSREDR